MSSYTPTRETSPALHDKLTSPFNERIDPPRKCSDMIVPLTVGIGIGAIGYHIYNRMKKPIPPKRNLTMSVVRNRY